MFGKITANVLWLYADKGKEAQNIGVCPNNANTKQTLTKAESLVCV